MELSIEEAVQRVKAEIIAPDWRLNARRIASLEEAFACLEAQFRNRKGLRAILTMAGNVLQYIKAKGDHSPPDSVDFLKEAMADVVIFYEEADDDSEREERVFQKILAHFQYLKRKIKNRKERRPPAPGPSAPAEPAASLPPAALSAPAEELEGFREPAKEETPVPLEAERLLAELDLTLQRAEEVGAALQELLQAAATIRGRISPGDSVSFAPAGSASSTVQGLSAESCTQPEAVHTKTPPTALREIMLGDQKVGLPEENIALIRPLAVAARAQYLREGQVPLRDFHRFFSSLGRQFEGMLATIPDRKLKKLMLPVMSFQAVGMPELPDAQATTLLVLSYGHWHGVLFASGIREELRIMTRFRKAANGDIAGAGILEDGGELPVANLTDLLRREGYLAIV